jgi:tetratricopeptide (TPR) repeat protein
VRATLVAKGRPSVGPPWKGLPRSGWPTCVKMQGMLAFLAASVLSAPDSVRADLRQADALYAQLYPYPIKTPGDNLKNALEVYEDIVAHHGPVPAAEVGMARCLFLWGRYREAAIAFHRAGARHLAEFENALDYADVSQAISKQSKPLTVLQLRHVPGIDRWVALLSVPGAESGWQIDEVPISLAVFRRDAATNRLEKVGKGLDLGNFWASYYSTLYLARLSDRDPEWRVLFFREGRADCDPFDVRILSVVPSGLRTIQEFDVFEGASVRGPSANHGLLVLAGGVWHVDWSDLFEWRGRGFKFANRRFPNFFKFEPLLKLGCAEWMTRAAELDIHSRFQEAKIAWEKALRSCRAVIRRRSRGLEVPYRDSGVYGDSRENLKEIIQRLGWLARHDYNHALLYRPIDRGFQVPPYKLGNAGDH